jgi:hypothetical protein
MRNTPYFHFRSRAERLNDWVNVYIVAIIGGTLAALLVLGGFYFLVNLFKSLLSS